MAQESMVIFMNDSGQRMRPKKPGALRLALVGIILATLVAVVAVFVSYRRLPVDPENAASLLKKTQADISLKQIRHTATRDGRDEWTLTAKSAQVQRRHNRTVIDSPSVVFFLNDGGEVHLIAKIGILMPETNDLEAVGDVTVTHEDYVMKTERLRYDHQNRVIYSKDPVTIKGNRFSIVADRMVYDLNSRTSTFKGNVESSIHDTLSL